MNGDNKTGAGGGGSVTPIPTPERDAIMGNVEQFKRNMASLIEYHKCLSQLRAESYKAHVAAGFTPDQAIRLVADLK